MWSEKVVMRCVIRRIPCCIHTVWEKNPATGKVSYETERYVMKKNRSWRERAFDRDDVWRDGPIEWQFTQKKKKINNERTYIETFILYKSIAFLHFGHTTQRRRLHIPPAGALFQLQIGAILKVKGSTLGPAPQTTSLQWLLC